MYFFELCSVLFNHVFLVNFQHKSKFEIHNFEVKFNSSVGLSINFVISLHIMNLNVDSICAYYYESKSLYSVFWHLVYDWISIIPMYTVIPLPVELGASYTELWIWCIPLAVIFHSKSLRCTGTICFYTSSLWLWMLFSVQRLQVLGQEARYKSYFVTRTRIPLLYFNRKVHIYNIF